MQQRRLQGVPGQAPAAGVRRRRRGGAARIEDPCAAGALLSPLTRQDSARRAQCRRVPEVGRRRGAVDSRPELVRIVVASQGRAGKGVYRD